MVLFVIICIVLLNNCSSPGFQPTSPSAVGMAHPGQLYAAAMWVLEEAGPGHLSDHVKSLTMEPCLFQGAEGSQMKTKC